jgi:hypothetical protein
MRGQVMSREPTANPPAPHPTLSPRGERECRAHYI